MESLRKQQALKEVLGCLELGCAGNSIFHLAGIPACSGSQRLRCRNIAGRLGCCRVEYFVFVAASLPDHCGRKDSSDSVPIERTAGFASELVRRLDAEGIDSLHWEGLGCHSFRTCFSFALRAVVGLDKATFVSAHNRSPCPASLPSDSFDSCRRSFAFPSDDCPCPYSPFEPLDSSADSDDAVVDCSPSSRSSDYSLS